MTSDLAVDFEHPARPAFSLDGQVYALDPESAAATRLRSLALARPAEFASVLADPARLGTALVALCAGPLDPARAPRLLSLSAAEAAGARWLLINALLAGPPVDPRLSPALGVAIAAGPAPEPESPPAKTAEPSAPPNTMERIPSCSPPKPAGPVRRLVACALVGVAALAARFRGWGG